MNRILTYFSSLLLSSAAKSFHQIYMESILLNIGIRVLEKVWFNNLVYCHYLFLSCFDLFFFEHKIFQSIVLACNLRNRATIWRLLELDLHYNKNSLLQRSKSVVKSLSQRLVVCCKFQCCNRVERCSNIF